LRDGIEIGHLDDVTAARPCIVLSLAVPVPAEYFAATHVVVAITATERVVRWIGIVVLLHEHLLKAGGRSM
jgi:hypothetical protein